MGEWVGCYTCPAPLNEHVSHLWCVCRGGRYFDKLMPTLK